MNSAPSYAKRLLVGSCAALFLAACGGDGGQPRSAGCAPSGPTIQFTSVPPLGSFQNLRGTTCNAPASSFAVAPYIKVRGGWWTKPYFSQPTVPIRSDGSWEADITTGGVDEEATDICAYLVPVGYQPPARAGQPDPLDGELDANAVAKVCTARTPEGTATPTFQTAQPSPSATPTTTPTTSPALSCPGGQVGDPTSSPSIEIRDAQASRITGVAQNVDGGAERVVCYAFTDCAYIQPDIFAWGTNICSDGSWSTFTYPWGRLVCLVVDQTTFPHPNKVCTARDTELCELPGVRACDRYPAPRVITFSQSDWEVKDSSGYLVGPGPNVFSASADNVHLDGAGALHLQAIESGQWTSSEIFRSEAAGFGVYECRIGSRLDHLDAKVVASCFIYESLTREIDFIECSPSLVSSPNQCQYVVQPYTTPGNIYRFPMPACQTSTHRALWLPDRIEFLSWCGHDTYPPEPSLVIAQWTYTGANIPPAEGRERARANLWLFKGSAPVGDGNTELTLSSFDVYAIP